MFRLADIYPQKFGKFTKNEVFNAFTAIRQKRI